MFPEDSKFKEVNTVSEAVPVWPAVRYILDTDQYWCTISGLSLFIYGIITVNPLEVWPVYALPTRGSKLITLPTCTSICYLSVTHLC